MLLFSISFISIPTFIIITFPYVSFEFNFLFFLVSYGVSLGYLF